MVKYKTEMHCHTAECSKCSSITSEEMINKYIVAGYSSIVITNHYGEKHFGKHGDVDEAEYFFAGYKKAKALANGRIDVLCGMKICFSCHPQNDYLVYGDVEAAFLKNPEVYKLELPDFCDWAHENNLLVYQAHPFRNGITIVNPSPLDGIEVFNGLPRFDSRNIIADAWAEYFEKKKLSGSDAHRNEDIARGGIITETRITNVDELISILKNEEYTLITQER